MVGLLRPNDLKEISSLAEIAKMEEDRQFKQKKEQQQQELREAFISREIQPEAVDRINRAVRIAAEQGHNQLEVLTFPCRFCSDGGRRINIADPEWPSTLEGFAQKAYQFFDKELRPLGYKLHAQIVSFPGGMPGDVGLFLKW
jgi:DNA-binding TFAR19-related protein (PDSD5 family)